MSTYYNCYKCLKNLRIILNEYSTEKLQGTDTSGAFNNEYLVDKINEAQRYLYALLLKEIPGFFMTSTSITANDSVFDLPNDFGLLVLFRDADNKRVYPIGIDATHEDTQEGSSNLYYRKGNSLVLDESGINDTYTLWYYKRPRDMTQGQASAGGAGTITFASTAKKVSDYYNDVLLENETQDWVDTISDYSTDRVATITETAVSGDFYGTISDLPEPFHHFIVPKAAMLVNSEFPVNTKNVLQSQVNFFNEELQTAISAYTTSEDIDVEELFTDYGISSSIETKDF